MRSSLILCLLVMLGAFAVAPDAGAQDVDLPGWLPETQPAEPAAAPAAPRATATARLTVRAFYETAAFRAGAGVEVWVDDVKVAETNTNGGVTLILPAGTHRVVAFDPFTAAAARTLALQAGTATTADLVMTSGGLGEVVPHRFVLAAGNVIPQTATGIVGEFLTAGGQRIVPTIITMARVLQANGTVEVDLTDRLRIASGRIATKANDTYLDLLSVDGEQILEIDAETAFGFPLHGSVSFRIGRHTLIGQLRAPPSAPTLAVGGMRVTVELLGVGLFKTVTATPAGLFTVTNVPTGNVRLVSTKTSGGRTYTLDGTLFVGASLTLDATPRGASDVLQGVPPISNIKVAAALAAVPARQVPAGQARLQPASRLAALADPLVTITATASTEDVRISDAKAVNIPQGTQTVVLKYEVTTAEYPYWVSIQSVYNDVWDLSLVTSAGVQLTPTVSRNVNSQLNATPPLWNNAGSTGIIQQVINVSALTKNGALRVVLAGSATNIGDSALATRVVATLSLEGDFTVEFVSLSNPNGGPEDVISIPRLDARNTFGRLARFTITTPTEAVVDDITRVEVRILLDGDLGPVVYDGPAKAVTTRTFTVPVTFSSPNTLRSPVESEPPPATSVSYRATVFATIDGDAVQDDAETAPNLALWRMPDGLPRYSPASGPRDKGGDDWATRRTYEWLDQNRSLITRINDVSGEHGMNIGHTEHRRGGDIDIFLFATLDATTAHDNFEALEEQALLAAGTTTEAPAARVILGTFIAAQRTGLTALANNSSVRNVRAGLGRPSGEVLEIGWLKTLLQTGVLRTKDGRSIRIASAVTLSSKIKYDTGHDDHNHISLD